MATNAEQEHDLICPECGDAFTTEQRLLTHRAKKHNYMIPMRAGIEAPLCQACGVNFHHPRRLLKHLKRYSMKNSCAEVYLKMKPLTEEQLRAVKKLYPAESDAKLVLKPPSK